MSLKALAEAISEHAENLRYAIFVVAGLSGGCYVAAYAYIRGRKVTPYLVLAYLVVGTVTALGSGIAIEIFSGAAMGWKQSFLVGTVAAVTSVLTLAGLRFAASIKVPYTDSTLDIELNKAKKDG